MAGIFFIFTFLIFLPPIIFIIFLERKYITIDWHKDKNNQWHSKLVLRKKEK